MKAKEIEALESYFKTENEYTPVYLGIYTFTDELQRSNLIYDWRAPIASMFYDFVQ